MNTNVIAQGTANAEATRAVGADVKAVMDMLQGGNPMPDWLKSKPLAEQKAFYDRLAVTAKIGNSCVADARKQDREEKAAERRRIAEEKAAEKTRKADEKAAKVSLGNDGSCFFLFEVLGHAAPFNFFIVGCLHHGSASMPREQSTQPRLPQGSRHDPLSGSCQSDRFGLKI